MEEPFRPEELLIHIVWPDNRFVSPYQIMDWAMDEYNNGKSNIVPKDLIDAITILEHNGVLTVDRRMN